MVHKVGKPVTVTTQPVNCLPSCHFTRTIRKELVTRGAITGSGKIGLRSLDSVPAYAGISRSNKAVSCPWNEIHRRVVQESVIASRSSEWGGHGTYAWISSTKAR